MSLFDKIIIPMIEPAFKPSDFTDDTGFIGCYTFDPDKPVGERQFLIAFDDNVRNEHVEDMSKRLEMSSNIKKIYTKVIDNKPYYIYVFYVNHILKKKYFDYSSFILPFEEKMKYLKFWGEQDEYAEKLCSNSLFSNGRDEWLPLADYRKSMFDRNKG